MQSNSVTIEQIIDMAEPHSLVGGKRTIIEGKRFILSIVGGRAGLYGDFIDNFEVAIIDKNTKEFVTKLFEPQATDDVMGYVSSEKVVEMANYIIKQNLSELE
jgi:hypothetical protein